MEYQNSIPSTTPHVVPVTREVSKPLQLVAAFLLGIVMLYGAGFVQTSQVHNAAHDVRHTLAFPCH